MSLSNAEIAVIFEEVADLLEIDGANPFRVRAYRNSAEYIADSGREMQDLVAADEDLTKLPSIGKDLAVAITDLVNTGTYADLEALRQRVNPSLREILRIPGLGPKKVKKLHDELGINTPDDLQAAVDTHKLADLEGFGVKTEAKIAKELAAGRTKKPRQLLADIEPVAQAMEAFVKQISGVQEACAAGSYRRRRDTVGDLDVVAAATSTKPVIDEFVMWDQIVQVVSQGDTRASVVLKNGLAADLRVVDPVSYGAALLYFTGSKDHNIVLRSMCVDNGWKLNEYGIYDADNQQIAGLTEAEVYNKLSLPYIEPELRENRGEIAAAQLDELPNLIDLEQMRGDIHCHTTWSDGRASIEEMARAALELGYDYVAITDHSPRLAMTGGLNPARLRLQAAEIREVQQRLPKITILHGNEVDILKDGSLDQPDDILAELEIMICSVHSHFDLSREEQTERMLRAIENPYCRIIGHPQGRLLTQRDPIALDLEAVFKAAAKAGVAMEINADPHRLDLDDVAIKFARECGVKFTISTDAHRVTGFDLMRHGIDQARRGWLEAGDVLNTRSLAGLRQELRPKP